MALQTSGFASALGPRGDLKFALRGDFRTSTAPVQNLADFGGGLRLYGRKRKMKTTHVEREIWLMRLKRLALLFLVSAVTGWVGYYVGVMRETSATHMSRGAMVGVDQLASAKSFSEVEQARAVLEALATRYVEDAQGLITQELLSRNANFEVRQSSSERPMVAAIKLLDEALPEFQGTGVELRLLQPLLYALKQERLYDRWLDVYLDALYRHPTHEVVSSLAEEAVAVSQAVGRERELTAGLWYLAGIPVNFPAKSRIENSLVRVRANAQIAGAANECHL